MNNLYYINFALFLYLIGLRWGWVFAYQNTQFDRMYKLSSNPSGAHLPKTLKIG